MSSKVNSTTNVDQQQQQLEQEQPAPPPHLQVPTGFPEVVMDLSREVLRAQPRDIHQFCADYFQHRLLKAAGGSSSNKNSTTPATNVTTNATPATQTNKTPVKATAHPSKKPISEPVSKPPQPKVEPRQQQQQPRPEKAEATSEEHSPIPSDTEDDDDVQMPPLPLASTGAARGRRTSVSAESMDPTSSEEYVKVVVPKTEEQRARIGAAVKNNFLFRNLDEEQYKDVVDAMAEKPLAQGEEVIQQGAVGDYFYIVETGTLDVWVAKASAPAAKVAQVGAGGSFGELALMYNAPRAATVVANADCILWALDRVSFRRILMDSTAKKRRMYESFLEEVPLLKSLEAYERHKIADALESVAFNDGEVVIKQGDAGDNFYMIESGDVVVTQIDENGQEHTVHSLTKGDYFGELALLSNKPRAATVTAKGKLKCVTLGKKAFDRLLGPALDIIKRNTSTYKSVSHRKSIEELVEHIEAGVNKNGLE